MRPKAAPSEHQQRPSFPPNRTRRAWTERTRQETRPTGKLFPARREAQSVQSSPGVAGGRGGVDGARGLGGWGSEGDAEDPPEHAEEPDEVAHLRRSAPDPGEGIGQDLRDSRAGNRELLFVWK